MKIRYFGFLANNCKTRTIILIRKLIGKTMKTFVSIKETVREKILRWTGNDILLCPHCGQGKMIFYAVVPDSS